jgi:translation initiation factor IF-1
MVSQTVKASISGRMVVCILVNLRTASNTGKESGERVKAHLVTNMKENTIWIRNTDMECFSGHLEISTRETTRMMREMAMVR